MAEITLREYAEKHGKDPAIVRQKLLRGGFSTARRMGHFWVIDEDEPYIDRRVTSGAYRGWRKKYPNQKKEQ